MKRSAAFSQEVSTASPFRICSIYGRSVWRRGGGLILVTELTMNPHTARFISHLRE